MILDKKDFIDIFSKCGFELKNDQYDMFLKFSELLVEWNKKINLTALVSPEDITYKHFLDSILPLKYMNMGENSSLIDVGTGAGFPAIPLKILQPDLQITLLDSLNKRINFLKEVSIQINISANFVHSRAEDSGRNPEMREQFDFSCARAVANLADLTEYCLPFVKIGGTFFALKGSSGTEEVSNAKNAIKKLGGEVADVSEYTLPTGDKRSLVQIKKISQTSASYPRNRAIMKKNPL